MLRKTPLRQKKRLERKKPMDISSMITTASTLGKPTKKAKRLKRKATGQLAVFKEIWNERPHVSEISGEPLVEMPDDPRENPDQMRAWVAQFSHVLPKGQYRRLRLDKRNIILSTWGENEFWGRWGLKVVDRCAKEWIPAWQRVVDLAIQLRDEQNGVNR